MSLENFQKVPLKSLEVSGQLPESFVFLTEVDPTFVESPRYATGENFLGHPVKGYTTAHIICTRQAANALKEAHGVFKMKGYKLVIYDAYRPHRAVEDFLQWVREDSEETKKAEYYPHLPRKELANLGYLARRRSSHSRGSTFDLTLIKEDQKLKSPFLTYRRLLNGEEIPYLDDNTLDMGTGFDLFHEASHHDTPFLAEECLERRQILREVMKAYGFQEYAKEWWHYTFQDEPYPDTYFDFVV